MRASFCSSLLAIAALWAAPAAAAASAPELRLRQADLETELAKKPDLYLVLDTTAKRLDVRARRLTLSGVELAEVAVLTFRPMFGGGAPAPALEAPSIWRVTEGPGDADRETIAPTSLRPYSEEEEEAEPPAAAPAPAATPAAAPGEERKPATYRVALDNGWQLLLTPESPRLGWFRRFGAAVRDGWQRLRGREPAHPPLVALVVAPEDARRLHHLFRTGTPILVTAAD
jgi:hypothetical protein